MADQALYESPPMAIGKHEWRVIVRPSLYGGNSTEYQWRPLPTPGLPDAGRQPEHWRHEEDWPGYNHNDGMYAGLPRTLKKLYERHEPEIKAALKGVPYQSPQPELFEPSGPAADAGPPASVQAEPPPSPPSPAASGHTPGDWRMVRHGEGSDYGPDAYTLWPQGIILKGDVSEAEARLIEAAPKLRDALTFAQRALNTAPRFQVGDTDSYKIAAMVDKALAAAKPSASGQAEPSRLPPDPDGMNFDRAAWADQAIAAFRDATGTDRDDALADLLADLMHWADRAGYDFREAFDRARGHYQAETTAEPSPPLPSPADATPHARPFNLVGSIIAFEAGELDEVGTVELFQHLVDTGLAWQMQGTYGRTARDMIEAGLIGPPDARPVPSVGEILADPKAYLSPEPPGGHGPEHDSPGDGRGNGRKR